MGKLDEQARLDLNDDDDACGGDRICDVMATAAGGAGGTGSLEALPALTLPLPGKRTVATNKKHLSGSMRGEGFFDRGKETSPVVLTNRKDLTG